MHVPCLVMALWTGTDEDLEQTCSTLQLAGDFTSSAFSLPHTWHAHAWRLICSIPCSDMFFPIWPGGVGSFNLPGTIYICKSS